MEYKLANGKFIKPGKPLIGSELVINYFPEKFLKEYVPEGLRILRNKKIEDILN